VVGRLDSSHSISQSLLDKSTWNLSFSVTKRHFYFYFYFLIACLSYLIYCLSYIVMVTVMGHTNPRTYHVTSSPDQSYDQACAWLCICYKFFTFPPLHSSPSPLCVRSSKANLSDPLLRCQTRTKVIPDSLTWRHRTLLIFTHNLITITIYSNHFSTVFVITFIPTW
jgi:hypothetical protein